MAFNPKDHYFKKAKENNFVARSIFKLEEINQKYKILRDRQRVLDLGASPGSWSQYVSKQIGTEGSLFSLDLQPLKIQLSNMTFVQGDAFSEELVSELLQGQLVDVVLSDMAPATTGIKSTDQARSFDLCLRALNVARVFLKPHGHCVVKFFHSGDFQNLKKEMAVMFEQVHALKPESTRSMSKEIFLIGLKKKKT